MVGSSPITSTCKNSVMNWNAWVGYSAANSAASATSVSLKAQSCVAGTGVGGYKSLCGFTCKYGYCPLSACTCTQLGKKIPEPTSLNKPGYPAPGIDGSFEGLCAYACNYGYCPSDVCSSTKTPFAAPSTDGPFPTCWKQECIAGRGNAKTPPESNGKTGCPVAGLSADYVPLCAFVCSHGYCPEGACTLQPAGTICPTAQPETAGWRDVTCDVGTLPSDLEDPAQRWKDAQADAAWADALQNYRNYLKNNPGTKRQFIEIIADYFHGTSARRCSDPSDDVCNQIIQCGQKNGLGVNSPAGYMILNSISNLHNMLYAFDKAITDTKAEFALGSSTVVAEFVNFSASNQFAVTTDVLGLLFGLAAGLTFNSWLKNIAAFKNQPEAFDNIKDGVNNLVSGGINLIKDTNLGGADGATVAAAFDVFAAEVLRFFTMANQESARKFFEGAVGPYNTDFLTAALKGGASAQPMAPNGAEIRDHLYMSIVGLLIPQAWTIGGSAATGGIHPFIMNAAGLPRKAGTTGCEGWDPSAYFDNRKIGVNAFVCAFGTEPYWILLGHQYCYSGPRPNQAPCTYDVISLPPGLDTINGVNYGGLRKEMLVSSAVVQFHKKEKNDLKLPDLSIEDNIINLAQQGISTPGMFPLPICGIQEALDNLHFPPDGNPNYPSNA
ncbi:hypothetical protein ONS96_008608 [Cadophora gregata f. sp. sojae]|nr:hypothetical protein ONS96_008608 [Cadophora gregata f. sp. sojae]